MPKARTQKGFTLVEAMVSLVIIGLISAVVAKLFTGGMKGWIFSNAQFNSQQKARVARDMVFKFLRQGRASSVVVSRLDSNQPPLSMLTFENADASRKFAFYQQGPRFYTALWEWAGTPWLSARQIQAGTAHLLIPNHVQRVSFFYPNLKDTRNLGFSLYSVWPMQKSVAEDVEIHLVGSVEIRNP